MSNTNRKRWTVEEDEFAYRNIYKMSDEELEAALDRSMNTIRKRLQLLLKQGKLSNYRKLYTQIEDEILLELHGTVPMDGLCNRVFRTKKSIYSRVRTLSGESAINSLCGDYTTNDVRMILGSTKRHVLNVIKRTDIPFKMIDERYLINQDEFWSWIKTNTDCIQAKTVDFEELYHCPEWYKDLVNQMKRETFNNRKKGEYSTKEIALAKHLKLQGKTIQEIADELNRSWRSIKYMFAQQRKYERELSKVG